MYAPPPPANAPQRAPDYEPMQVEITLSAKRLPNLDVSSRTDPQAVLYYSDPHRGAWVEVGRTEMIKDALDPTWVRFFEVNYFFEEVQHFRVAVYDIDEANGSLEDQDFIGQAEFVLGEVIGSKGNSKAISLSTAGKHFHGSHDRGYLIVHAEEKKKNLSLIRMRMSGAHLDKKDRFGKSDPFVRIFRTVAGAPSVLVHETEVIRKTLDPHWNVLELPGNRLNGNDPRNPIRFEVYDWDKDGTHDLIGVVEAPLADLRAGSRLPLINDELRRKKKKYTNSGELVFDQLESLRLASFLEYLQGGCEVSLMVAVDFTASNGAPQDPRSLHYLDPRQPNQYYKAIASVGEILQAYDSDKQFPMYGFGAKVPPSYDVSFCFPLNFNPQNPYVQGVQGLLDTYMQSVSRVQLYGPTNFAPIIDLAANSASDFISQEAQHYLILLILTDGAITDMDATLRAIARASVLPVSIVIVGVGEADFGKMNELDGDESATGAAGSKRDVVQFVAMRDYARAWPGALAKDLLAEIPNQLVSFMRANNIQPNLPQQADLGPPPPIPNAAPPPA